MSTGFIHLKKFVFPLYICMFTCASGCLQILEDGVMSPEVGEVKVIISLGTLNSDPLQEEQIRLSTVPFLQLFFFCLIFHRTLVKAVTRSCS